MGETKPALIPGTWNSDKSMAKIFDCSRGHIWELTKRGELPAPRKFSTKTVRWSSDEVIAKLNQVA